MTFYPFIWREADLSSLWDRDRVPAEFPEAAGSGCGSEEVWLNQLLCTGGQAARGGGGCTEDVSSRTSAPPAGTPEQRIWLKRRRRGMLLFSSALWRSGAKIADSSSIHTGSRSTHSPVGHMQSGLNTGGRLETKRWTFAFRSQIHFYW